LIKPQAKLEQKQKQVGIKKKNGAVVASWQGREVGDVRVSLRGRLLSRRRSDQLGRAAAVGDVLVEESRAWIMNNEQFLFSEDE
jgi:hypothetical protein